jgi:hypothetical protein
MVTEQKRLGLDDRAGIRMKWIGARHNPSDAVVDDSVAIDALADPVEPVVKDFATVDATGNTQGQIHSPTAIGGDAGTRSHAGRMKEAGIDVDWLTRSRPFRVRLIRDSLIRIRIIATQKNANGNIVPEHSPHGIEQLLVAGLRHGEW